MAIKVTAQTFRPARCKLKLDTKWGSVYRKLMTWLCPDSCPQRNGSLPWKLREASTIKGGQTPAIVSDIKYACVRPQWPRSFRVFAAMTLASNLLVTGMVQSIVASARIYSHDLTRFSHSSDRVSSSRAHSRKATCLSPPGELYSCCEPLVVARCEKRSHIASLKHRLSGKDQIIQQESSSTFK